MHNRIDVSLGSPVLPSAVRRVRETNQGVTFYLDTEDHDKGLLRAIADAVRVDEEFIENLRQYAEIQNRLDTEENPKEVACLRDEADDLLHEMDRAMEWQSVGEGMTAPVSENDTEILAAVLVRVTANQIQARSGRVLEPVGGAA